MQEVVKWAAVGCLLFVVGCRSIPLFDEAGQPTGEEVVVVDPAVIEPADAAVQVVSQFLPPPWNVLASAAMALVAGIRIRRKAK